MNSDLDSSNFPMKIEEFLLKDQIFITGLWGYLTLFLFIIVFMFLILSLINDLKFKNKKIYTIILYSIPFIILLSNTISFLHLLNQEDIALFIVNDRMVLNIESDLFLRGFYVSKIIIRYQLLIVVMALIAYIPIIKRKKEIFQK